MARRVAISLELEVAQYTTRSGTVVSVTKAMESAVDELGDAADATSGDMAQLAANADVARRQIDDVGEESLEAAAEIRFLGTQIEATQRSLRELAREFDATGDLELLVRIRQERSHLSGLMSAQRLLSDLTPGLTAAGATAGEAMSKGVLDALGALPSELKGALLVAVSGALLLTAPLVGAAIGGAVTGGVGIGGIAGGIALASQDPGVKSAATSLGKQIMRDLTADGRFFVEPVKDALEILGQTWSDIAPDIRRNFEILAPAVEDLARGVGQFFRELMPGLTAAFENAGPVIALIGDELGDTGAALGDFLATVSESEGILTGLEVAFDILNGAIRATGVTVDALSDAFESMMQIQARVSGALEDLPIPTFADAMAIINDGTEKWLNHDIALGSSIHRTTGEIEAQAQATADLTVKLSDLFGVQVSVDEALLNWRRGLLDLKRTLKENAGAFGENTEKALANERAVFGMIKQAINFRDAEVAAGKGVDVANRNFNNRLDLLRDLATQAGVTREKFDDLAGEYRIGVTYDIKTIGSPPKLHLGKNSGVSVDLPGRAAGGDVQPHQAYLVGERGIPEVFASDVPGTIYPSVAAYQSAMSMGMAGYSSASRGWVGTQTLTVEVPVTLIDPMTGDATRRTLIRRAVNAGVPEAQARAAYP